MKNRESLYPGRVKLTPVDAANGIYDMVRADEPQDPGTPLNKKLLDYAVAACGVTAGTATAYTLDDEFGGFELVDGAKVSFRLHVASGENPTLNVNGTGAKRIMNVYGDVLPLGTAAGVWLSAIYSSSADVFVTNIKKGLGVSAEDIDNWNSKTWNLITKYKIESTVPNVTVDFTDEYDVYRLTVFGYLGNPGEVLVNTTSGIGMRGGRTTIRGNNAVSHEWLENGGRVIVNDISQGYFSAEIYVSWYRQNLSVKVHGEMSDRIVWCDYSGNVVQGGIQINSITLSAYLNPPTTIVLEGIKA